VIEVENNTRVRYRTNTEEGSSGSPCFNQDWELVALHHSGDPNFERPATYNEGIPFEAILKRLAAKGAAGEIGT
jgi:V8-like Glu-specific endopeptidase